MHPDSNLQPKRSTDPTTILLFIGACCTVVFIVGIFLVKIWGSFAPSHPPHFPMDIEQLTNAMNSYKESTSEYPPCCAEADPKERRERFMRHLSVAFPNSFYGLESKDFERLRTNLRTPGGLGTASQPYTYRKQDGTIALLDLDTLDPTEALVFWLAGFPTPASAGGVPVAPPRTYGFNRDKDNPFRRDSAVAEATDPMRFRTDARMDFKQDHFADSDGDGWLEYLPQRYAEGTLQAPFVYFDSPTYVASSQQPATLGTIRYPDDARRQAEWGVAVPLCEQFAPARIEEAKWVRPKTFQLIDPGRDGRYGSPSAPNERRVIEYPSGRTWRVVDGQTSAAESLAKEELDNQTNLGVETVGEARKLKQP